ncbi:caspase domain-containing protein [Obelidium mucronatum]|nr:caspase domain-containing protein [Obelidium mucronatum]
MAGKRAQKKREEEEDVEVSEAEEEQSEEDCEDQEVEESEQESGEENEGEVEEEDEEENEDEEEVEDEENESANEDEEEQEEEEEEQDEADEEEDEEEEELELPDGWVQQYSHEYQCYFYCNTETGETQWHAPGTIPAEDEDETRDPYQMHHDFTPSGRKKALFVGINYEGTDNQLGGCINDANNLKDFMIENYGLEDSKKTILLLTDDNENQKKRPTYKNILAGFVWLLAGAQAGDELVFTYSGHGGRDYVKGGDHDNDMENCLIPEDYETGGDIIRCDDVHEYLVAALPPGVKLTAILDCCHSGTMMELPYSYKPDPNSGKMSPKKMAKTGKKIVKKAQQLLSGPFTEQKIEDAKKLFGDVKNLAAAFLGDDGLDDQGYKKENYDNDTSDIPKLVFCFSGCRDIETSQDVDFGDQANGALTRAIMSELTDNDMTLSYQELLMKVRGVMKKTGMDQFPQLCCGIPVDPNSAFSF